MKYGIQGFPTIKWFDGVSTEPTDYQGGRDLDSLQAFITEKTGKAPKKKVAPPSNVKHLTDRTFKDAIGGNKDVLVAFTAPWCGRMFISSTQKGVVTSADQTHRLQDSRPRLGASCIRLRAGS